jgi:hypothetical protein
MFNKQDFEEIRPYDNTEVNAAIGRIISSPLFDKILSYIFPLSEHPAIKQNISRLENSLEFQRQFVYGVVTEMLKRTTGGLTSSGFSRLEAGKPYTFVSNHRDIVLDAAILDKLLFDHGHETAEITFGSNLMTSDFIIDLGKINRMFVVNRGNNGRDIFRNSQLLSSYIRYTLTEKKVSVWIAQRNGRTKDGNDCTEPALLKMFNYSGNGSFRDSFNALNIIPVAVSYEFEPCCAFKIRETSITRQGLTYRKSPDEDLTSIITGLTQPKGRIHLAVSGDTRSIIDEADMERTTNEKLARLSLLIDREIQLCYRLWPNNYIAWDMRFGTDEYSLHYNNNDIDNFRSYMDEELSMLTGIDEDVKKSLFLKIYSNPVINRRKLKDTMNPERVSDCLRR